MNIAEFDLLLEELTREEYEVLKAKGQDYTRDDPDRLANFKRIARDIGCSPLLVWYVYFTKHIDAIASFVKTGKVESEGLRGRFIDARNYLALGYALYLDPHREDAKALLDHAERVACIEEKKGRSV